MQRSATLFSFAILILSSSVALAQGSFGRTEGRGALQQLDRVSPGQTDPGSLVEQHNIAGLAISDLGKIRTDKAGEVVAAVVPPGKKAACPAGRLLVGLDKIKEPKDGVVVGRNLLNLDGTTIRAKVTGYANTGIVDGKTTVIRRVKSNDQDLGVLPNGDVIYVRMGQTRAPLPSKPSWFDYAYKIIDGEPLWGPGARSELLIFRSEDCGGSFHLVSTIDSAKLLNGLAGFQLWDGGLPQRRCDGCPVRLRDGRAVWQMAGTDGPTLKIDPNSGAALLSVGIFGYLRPEGASGFTLSEEPIRRTIILRSVNRGDTWPRTVVLAFSAWRQEMIPIGAGELAIGAGRSFRRMRINNVAADGLTPLESDIVTVPGPPVVWTGFEGDLAGNHFDGLRGQTMSTRLPGGESALLLIRDTADGSDGGPKGYRAYSYDWTDPGYFLEYVPPIAPEREGRSNFIYNPVLVDAGDGPILAYWYDVTTDNQDPNRPQWAKIKGRLFFGRQEFTPDFTIRSLFDVTKDRFYGHYQMAGGFHTATPSGDRRTTFFPVWIEPDGDVRFAKVEYFVPGDRLGRAPGRVAGTRLGRVSAQNRIQAVPTRDRAVPLLEREEHVRNENRLELEGPR